MPGGVAARYPEWAAAEQVVAVPLLQHLCRREYRCGVLPELCYNLTAKQVLDIVTMSFDYPIQYVILDQGVVFVQKPASQQGYFTRTFKLNPSAVLGFPDDCAG